MPLHSLQPNNPLPAGRLRRRRRDSDSTHAGRRVRPRQELVSKLPPQPVVEIPVIVALPSPPASDTMPTKPQQMGASHPRPARSATRDAPAVPSSSSSSAELGEGDFAVVYNPRTGRPQRKSASKREFDGYLDPDHLDPADLDFDDMDPSDDDLVDDDFDSNSTKRKLALRRKKKSRAPVYRLPSLSPPLPDDFEDTGAIPPIESDAPLPSSDSNQDYAANGREPCRNRPEVLSLTFNIASGFQGPLRVEIPRSAFSSATPPPRKRVKTSGSRPETTSIGGSVTPRSVSSGRSNVSESQNASWGWSKLPAELRNRIYRMVFSHKDELDFHHPFNFQLSAQFLRACRQVHDEGRTVLYSENRFTFERNKNRRCRYFEAMPREIGWKDVRLFLTSIGPENVSLLRHVFFVCEDAMPSTTPALSHEDRRFIYDPNLLECLGILARYGRLRSIRLCLLGRKMITRADDGFLAALKKVKADSVKLVRHPRYGWHGRGRDDDDEDDDGLPDYYSVNDSKVQVHLRKHIVEMMTRKRRMYPLH